jgi:hypothetical protein
MWWDRALLTLFLQRYYALLLAAAAPAAVWGLLHELLHAPERPVGALCVCLMLGFSFWSFCLRMKACMEANERALKHARRSEPKGSRTVSSPMGRRGAVE